MDGCIRAQPDAILFDLDNTLCTFVDAKRAACNAAVSTIGCGKGEDLFAYFLRPVHNFEDHAHITDYLTDIGAFSPEIADLAGHIYDTVKLDTITLYPGVIESLEILIRANVRIALVTDAHSSHARLRMNKLGITRYFPILITPDISGRRKPDHTPFLMAMELLGTRPSETWVVGDSIRREIIPGLEIGLTTVFARYGDWINADIPDVRPHYILDQFRDLVNLAGLS